MSGWRCCGRVSNGQKGHTCEQHNTKRSIVKWNTPSNVEGHGDEVCTSQKQKTLAKTSPEKLVPRPIGPESILKKWSAKRFLINWNYRWNIATCQLKITTFDEKLTFHNKHIFHGKKTNIEHWFSSFFKSTKMAKFWQKWRKSNFLFSSPIFHWKTKSEKFAKNENF